MASGWPLAGVSLTHSAAGFAAVLRPLATEEVVPRTSKKTKVQV